MHSGIFTLIGRKSSFSCFENNHSNVLKCLTVGPFADASITIKDGIFKWDPSAEKPTLKK